MATEKMHRRDTLPEQVVKALAYIVLNGDVTVRDHAQTLRDELFRQAAEIARLRAEVEALRRLETLAPEIIPALEATGVNVSLAADVRKAADAARNLPDPGTG